MRRICVLGNSHTVAIKDGWSLLNEADRGDFEPSFYAIPNDEFNDFRLENGRLIPGSLRTSQFLSVTSQGASFIELADFEAFLLVGLDLRVGHLVNIYDNFRLLRHNDPMRDLISEDALRAALVSILRSSSCASVLNAIRKVSSAPVAIFPEPTPTKGMRKGRRFLSDEITEIFPDLQAFFLDTLTRSFAGEALKVITQPATMLDANGLTNSLYSVGAGRIWEHRERYAQGEENRHMNGDYGAQMLMLGLPFLLGAARLGSGPYSSASQTEPGPLQRRLQ